MTTTQEILETIEDHANRRADVADVLQTVLLFSMDIDWPAVNAAIIERWSMSGLKHIKRLAWSEGPIPGLREETSA